MKLKNLNCLLLLLIFFADSVYSLSQAKEKKLIVEVEPADYDNNVLESLREQEDVKKKYNILFFFAF